MKNKNFLSFISLFILSASVLIAAKIGTDILIIGNKAAEDVAIEFDVGSGANNPLIKWNNASNALQFTNNGVNFFDIGSGSGGGGGANYYVNSDFESGVAEGVAVSSGVGTVGAETGSPIKGSQSAIVTQGAGAAVVVDFEISGIDNFALDAGLIPLSEAVIKLDAADADGDATWGIWNVTDGKWLQGPSSLKGAGIVNFVRELTNAPLESGKTYVGRLTRVDNTTSREILLDRLSLDPENKGGVISIADQTLPGLVPSYEEFDAVLDGGFSGGTRDIKIIKIGKLNVLTGLGTPTHSNASAIQTNVGFLPSRFRPQTTTACQSQTLATTAGNIITIIQSDGTIRVEYADFAGAGQNRTDPNGPLRCSWVVP